ncbi:MAG: HAD family hydrolase [Sedimentisphaerales bacterium]|nr:HAD family hydrolase [Sedimentisphaerales bacterium]
MGKLSEKKGYICDMDGVIYHGSRLVEGAKEFVDWMKKEGKRFLFLTNSSSKSPKELRQKLFHLGIDVDPQDFITSGQATASFLASQNPNTGVYVIGESGLINALYEAGFYMDQAHPTYVIVGESRTYNFEQIDLAVHLVLNGAKLIGTNSDLTGPTEKGIAPACRALVAPIELATGRKAYFIGKPNPLMMRHAIQKIDCRLEDTLIVGDRMDTDIIAGIESGIETALVLSGITKQEDLVMFPYQPNYIFDRAVDIIHAE